MKKILLTLVSVVGLVGALEAEVINAVKVPGDVSKVGVSSKAWLSAEFTDVMLYPQTTIKMNDREANVLNSANTVKRARIKALHDGKHIAFMILWKDATESIQQGINSSYGDGFAVQIATKVEDVKQLPYIGMGSKDRPVLVHLKKATGVVYEPDGAGNIYHQVGVGNQNLYGADLQQYTKAVMEQGNDNHQRVFIAEGFRAMTQIKEGSSKSRMELVYKGGVWRGILNRNLDDAYIRFDKGAIPVAFALWDGDKKNRDGLKHLSTWTPVKLVGTSGGEALINELTAPTNGSIKNGEKLVLENCAACHRYKGAEMAIAYMAPGLDNIGGYSTDAYLMESLVKPSAVVVPGYNPNAHKNYPWYNINEKGERVSTMPPYDWMDEQSRQDIVAYLKTLKAEGK